MENVHTWHKLKYFRSHYGGESIFGLFNQFLYWKWHFKTTHNSLDSLAKWGCWEKNHTLIESVRNMFFSARLVSKMFWIKAIALVIYVQKRILKYAIGDITLEGI
jgi:hypothetical protein